MPAFQPGPSSCLRPIYLKIANNTNGNLRSEPEQVCGLGQGPKDLSAAAGNKGLGLEALGAGPARARWELVLDCRENELFTVI